MRILPRATGLIETQIVADRSFILGPSGVRSIKVYKSFPWYFLISRILQGPAWGMSAMSQPVIWVILHGFFFPSLGGLLEKLLVFNGLCSCVDPLILIRESEDRGVEGNGFVHDN